MSQIQINEISTDFSKEDSAPIKAVMEINAFAGNQITDPSQYPAQLQRQTLIDLGECLELLTAVVEGDIEELRDGLADKQVTLFGFANIVPFSLSDDIAQTVKNQMTRFDYTETNAFLTQEKYAKLGVETYIEKNQLVIDGVETFAYVNKVKEDCVDIRGESYNKGKFVKSVNFVKDNFSGEYPELLPTDDVTIKERYLAIRKRLADWMHANDIKYSI